MRLDASVGISRAGKSFKLPFPESVFQPKRERKLSQISLPFLTSFIQAWWEFQKLIM